MAEVHSCEATLLGKRWNAGLALLNAATFSCVDVHMENAPVDVCVQMRPCCQESSIAESVFKLVKVTEVYPGC